MSKLTPEVRRAKYGDHLVPGEIKVGDMILFRHMYAADRPTLYVVTKIVNNSGRSVNLFPLELKGADGVEAIGAYEEAFKPQDEPWYREEPVQNWKKVIAWDDKQMADEDVTPLDEVETHKPLTLEDLKVDAAYFFHNSQVVYPQDKRMDGKVCVVIGFETKAYRSHPVDVLFAGGSVMPVRPEELTPFS